LAKGNLDDYQKELEKLKDHERYERVVAAGAGAYVWGHMTQFIGPGQDKTLVELLDEYGLTMDWEAHTTGPEGKGKLWKPRDIIKVCKAINDTEVNGVKHDVMRATIDMEHLAVNGVNPLWVIEGNEEKGFKGLDPGDARFISKQHVTHPALSEQQHEHQPIRRGDTIVYRHLESLVERGFCQREDRPCIILYELGGEKAESTFMLRLMMHMLELGITSEELESGVVDKAMEKFDQGSEDLTLREYTILKFFGLTDEEWHHEWQKIFEHALDPLSGLLEIASPEKTWSGSRPIQEGTRPEEWEEEKYQ
ncbi:MAG: hypothetical protein SVV03_06170, partial [Candidatus Nanohaloarchaea archaeon]|nr:hypothetical protein [Candidatus Nanohaloarchaea archaeon]